LALFNPIIVKRNHTTSPGSLVKDAINDPIPTQLSDNGLHIMHAPIVMNAEHDGRGKKVRNSVNDPTFVQTTRATQSIISTKSFQAFLSYYYSGSNQASDIKEPTRTFSSRDRVSLVIRGERPRIEDCYYRMLLALEVKLGMAFRPNYIVLGNSREQVKQLGNAVTPPAMEFLVERCIETLL
jgi:DNA (cytosine-5)-methyltransferase 1